MGVAAVRGGCGDRPGAGGGDSRRAALLSGRLLPPAQTALLFDVPDVPAFDGDDDPDNNPRAHLGYGLARLPVGDLVFWGKTGDRPGYNNGMHMGGSEQPEITKRIIVAVSGLA